MPAISLPQIYDNPGELLAGNGTKGGPIALSQQLARFFLGINDPLGQNPTGASFSPEIFGLYSSWDYLRGHSPKNEKRQAIARGEVLFNTTKINITGVAGLNDVLNQSSIPGFCGTCHDTPNVGTIRSKRR